MMGTTLRAKLGSDYRVVEGAVGRWTRGVAAVSLEVEVARGRGVSPGGRKGHTAVNPPVLGAVGLP
jgi:hypothetical protein